uniref:LRAT domain-containing protein n=1 Tax=Panagrellus redivivus TaxID=6233 RepID=A0A7E4UP20_PANRE
MEHTMRKSKLQSEWMKCCQILPKIKIGDLIEIRQFIMYFDVERLWAVVVENAPHDKFVVVYESKGNDFAVNYNTNAIVCRKRLSTIALSNDCRINNLNDLNYPPFQEAEVITRALSNLGACKKNTNSENFAKECRNGAAGWMSYSQLLPHIKPGYLIEIKPKIGLYDWAVAIKKEHNDYFVVHANDREVKYESLLDIVGQKECRINHLNDLENAAFPENIIVKRAMRNVGMVINNQYHQTAYFAKVCRNGIAGWMSYNILLHYVKPGDLIEIERVNLGIKKIYHWAVAVEVESDDCFVVNLTDDSVVHRERLSKITFDKNCRINNSHDEQCPPFEAEEVVKRAISRHFAKYCRNGDATSHQVLDNKYFLTAGDWIRGSINVSASVKGMVTGQEPERRF